MKGLKTSFIARVLPFALASISLAWTTGARAQAQAIHPEAPLPTRAEQLFAEALRLMQADHCQDAIPLFSESQHLDPAAATLTNLATCYARVGKTATAYRMYQQASRAAILEQKPELQRNTDQAIQSLAPTLTRLKIVPLGTSELPQIRVNGVLIDDLREPVPLDPGENIIEATAPEHDPWRRTVQTPGEASLMVVEVPELPPAAKTFTPPEAVPAKTQTQFSPALPQETQAPNHLRTYAILTGGIGLSALAVGTILTLSARSKYDEASAYCDGSRCTNPGASLRNAAIDRANAATWLVGIGAVSTLASVILFTRSPGNPPETAHVRFEPTLQVSSQAALLGVKGAL